MRMAIILDEEKEMSKIVRKKGICLAGAVLIASNLVFTGCGSQETAAVVEENKDLLVEVMNPATESIYLYNDFMGTIESSQEVVVMPKTGGTVTNKYFEVGDTVNAGDMLFTLDDEAIRISLTTAEANLKSAQAGKESAQVGYEAQVAQANAQVTTANATVGTMGSTEMGLQSAVDNAKKKLEQAEAAAKLAEETYNLEYKQIKFSQDDYDDAKDAKEDAEDKIEEIDDELNRFRRYEEYASNGDWDNFKRSTGVELDDTATAEEIEKAIVDKIGSTKDELHNQRDKAITARNTADDSIDALKYARDGQELKSESNRVNKENALDMVESAKQALEIAQQQLTEYQNYQKAQTEAGAQSTFAGAQATLANANSNLTSVDASLTAAQANVESAQLQLEYTKIHAPVTGVITEINVSEHNMVNAGMRAYVISSEDGIKAVFYVSEKVMRSIQEGQAVILERNGENYDAVITNVSNVVDAANGLFKVEAAIEGDTSALITGSSVKLKTVVESAESVMALPIDSVYYENQEPYVFCMADGKAVKTPIETGISDDKNIQILSGLTPESQVITSWASGLSDGVGVYTEDRAGADTAAVTGETAEETAAQTETDAAAQTEAPEEAETAGGAAGDNTAPEEEATVEE